MHPLKIFEVFQLYFEHWYILLWESSDFSKVPFLYLILQFLQQFQKMTVQDFQLPFLLHQQKKKQY